MSHEGEPRTGGTGSATAASAEDRPGRRRDEPRRWIYQNLTPWRIHASYAANAELCGRVAGDGPPPHTAQLVSDVTKVLSIPALGEVVVPRERSAQLVTLKMRRLGQIEVRPAPSELLDNLPQVVMIFGWIAVGLAFGAWALFFGGASGIPWAWLVAAVVAVPVVALLTATWREVHLYLRFARYREERIRSDPAVSFEGIERGSRIRGFVDGVPRHAAEAAVLIGAILVSVVGLGVAIHLTTQLNDLLPIDYAKFFSLDDPFADVNELARSSPAFWQLLVGHVAQWVLVSVAALVPAAMYFQFDRQRLASVRRRWIQEVFRLDPTVRTVRDIEAKYGSQMESSFGDLRPDSTLRLGSGRRSPVIVATILLVVGWFLVISTTNVPDLVLRLQPSTSAPGISVPELVWPSGQFPVSSFFRPDLSLLGYAFLGAYVFTLFHVIRGYQRRDLHPKTYNTIVVRILAAYALGVVMSVIYTGPAAEVMMFFVGFMPQSALVWMREQLTGESRFTPLREPAPLTDLEGIDLYDRTRLAEEGINNVEALAHADIVNLMSSTRISAAQLVDWTDQAILYLHVGGDLAARAGRAGDRRDAAHLPVTAASTEAAEEPAIEAPVVVVPDVHENLAHLRSFGVRTASDLMQVYEEALRRGSGAADEASCDRAGHDEDVRSSTAARQAAEVGALRKALDLPSVGDHQPLGTIQTIIDTLVDEEWFAQIRNWRRSEFTDVDAWYLYLDGHDWDLTRPEHLPCRVEQAKAPYPTVRLVEDLRQAA